MIDPVDPDRCPLCAGENTCGMRAGSSICWCFTEQLAPGVLDRVPLEARHVACLCRQCATGRPDPQRIAEPVEDVLRALSRV